MEGWFDNAHPALRRCWHPVGYAADLDAGPFGCRLLGEPWAVVRLDGGLAAFADRCPHRFAPLSAGSVVGDSLECRYHGWRFGADGRCVEVPALGADSPVPPKAACRTAARVTEHLGLVWVALEEPVTPLPKYPEWDDSRYGPVPLDVQEWNAGAAQMADNFLDVAHFPFVHLGTIGDPTDRVVKPYDVARDGWEFFVEHRHQSPAMLGGGLGESRERVMRFDFTAPHHVVLRLQYPDLDNDVAIGFFHQPVDATTTRLFTVMSQRDVADGRTSVAAAAGFQLAVAAQDKDLLERFPLKAVPLDATVEVHTRADKITLELRRVLAELAGAPGRS